MIILTEESFYKDRTYKKGSVKLVDEKEFKDLYEKYKDK